MPIARTTRPQPLRALCALVTASLLALSLSLTACDAPNMERSGEEPVGATDEEGGDITPQYEPDPEPEGDLQEGESPDPEIEGN